MVVGRVSRRASERRGGIVATKLCAMLTSRQQGEHEWTSTCHRATSPGWQQSWLAEPGHRAIQRLHRESVIFLKPVNFSVKNAVSLELGIGVLP